MERKVVRIRFRLQSMRSSESVIVRFTAFRMYSECDQNVGRAFLKLSPVMLLFVSTVLFAYPRSTFAQETPSDWAWTPITRVEGVEFLYIFYREADTENNGVVLKLVNWNEYPVRYRFLVLFKSGRDEYKELVTGRIDAKTFVTGDEPGLFFIPFKDGRSIGEIGLKAYRITKPAERTKVPSSIRPSYRVR